MLKKYYGFVIKAFCLLLICALALCPLVACVDTENDTKGSMTVVIAGDTPAVYSVDLENVEITEGVLSILKYLKETKDLEYTAQESEFGAYMTSIGALVPGASEYVCIYTSVASDFDVSSYAKAIEYEGRSLTTSGLGVSDMTIKDGCIIYFELSDF